MGKRPKRKIVLFLVEGKSDREALNLAIPELYDEIDDEIEVFFPIIREESVDKGGDITSKYGVFPNNIESKIYELFLRDFFNEEKIMPKDIYEIVQIVDVDGTYLPDEKIIESTENEERNIVYSNDSIITKNVEGIRKRNKRKADNLNYLSSLEKIKVKQKSVKYSVYYFSSNMDHFIHRDANLDSNLKIMLADSYSRGYIGKTNEFVKDICQDKDATKEMTYEESWAFIKNDTNSVKRHTNLNILLEKLQDNS